jgi:hypothetical protein
MSVKARLFWIIPAILVASWLAVRSLAASPARNPHDKVSRGDIGDPPIPLASLSRELRDPALARYIGGLAVEARKN